MLFFFLIGRDLPFSNDKVFFVSLVAPIQLIHSFIYLTRLTLMQYVICIRNRKSFYSAKPFIISIFIHTFYMVYHPANLEKKNENYEKR